MKFRGLVEPSRVLSGGQSLDARIVEINQIGIAWIRWIVPNLKELTGKFVLYRSCKAFSAIKCKRTSMAFVLN